MSTLDMEKEYMQRDVAMHVEWKLEHNASFEYLAPDLKSEIAQKLIYKSHRMYNPS